MKGLDDALTDLQDEIDRLSGWGVAFCTVSNLPVIDGKAIDVMSTALIGSIEAARERLNDLKRIVQP